MSHQITEAMIKTSDKMIVGGSGLSGASWLWSELGSNSEAVVALCAIVGAGCAISGLIINVYAAWQRHRRGE